MNDRELMQMALDALQESKPIDINDPAAFYRSAHAIEALRARLAQPEQGPVAYTGNGTFGREADVQPTGFFFQIPKPEQEPVAWRFRINNDMYQKDKWHLRLHKVTDPDAEVQPLYTAPPQREWQRLTDEEAFNAFDFHLWPESFLVNVSQELKDTHEEAKKEVLAKIRAIEAKLKEKNT